MSALSPEAEDLLGKLTSIAQRGPIPSVREGSTGIGMTLLDAVGVPYSSVDKPRYRGIVLTATRAARSQPNRVNLFAKVPDWDVSECKSSEEIVEKYGYPGDDGGLRLFCTVQTGRANPQGLYLKIDRQRDTLEELYEGEDRTVPVATWRLEGLRHRLRDRCPESMWVTAKAVERDGREHFHYRRATYTSEPRVDLFADLIDAGTITVDHLIERRRKEHTREKGPLFKIKPTNMRMLFPEPTTYDLLARDK